MGAVPERWDGRTWFVRVVMAGLAAVAAAADPTIPLEETVAVAVAVSCGWIPLIAVAERLRLARPALVTTLVSAAVDLAALAVLDAMTPALGPTLLLLTLPGAVLHAGSLTTAPRLLLALGVLVTQLVIAASGLPGFDVGLLVAADAGVLLLSARMLTESDRRNRLSRAALAQADQLTDAVLAGVAEAVVVTDASGVITSTNAAAEVTFGAEARGACAAALGLQRGAAELDCSGGCPLLEDGSDTAQVDVRRAHPSGTTQALLVNVRALRDPLGRVREVVHSYRDVTRMKQAEQAKTLFLATASHELKTPLAVMTGFAALLADDNLDAERRGQAVATILNRGEQLSTIIDRLLLASRIDGGGVSLSTQPTDVHAVVAERVGALRDVTVRDLRLHSEQEPLPKAEADHTALATVIDHLVENAVKYSPEGGPVDITIALHERTITVDVTDHGVGMAADHAEHCFEPFWQAESADTRRFGGSGVGLYIVRSLSRAMGGDTAVLRSVPGEGTTFRLTLARCDAAPLAVERVDEGVTMVDDFLRQVGARRGG